MKSRLILVTKDKALEELIKKAAEAKRVKFECLPTPKESFARWADEETQLLGVIGDLALMNQQEKIEMLQAHCQPGCPSLVLLDPPGMPDPRTPTEFVTRLSWPLPDTFMTQLKEIEKVPMVFLVDPTIFVTGMLQTRLTQIGIRPMPVENHMGIAQMLRSVGGEDSPLSSTLICQFKGDVFDAAPVEQRVRQEIPNVRFFLLTSASAAHCVDRGLRNKRPSFLPRELADHVVEIIRGKQAVDPGGLGRVLLVDNFKPSLIQQTHALIQKGYEVAACMKAEEAIEYTKNDNYHIAVVGAALVYAQYTGVELAQKMRELDPDMRIILMVDRYPLQTALQGVTQVVEVGLDDCLLKPVEPSRLQFSISRALERRKLLIENKRLLDELQSANEELAQLTGFQQKFFATVAHDVKNPLTAIRGYAEMLSWKVKEASLVKCVNHIQSSTRTLEGLISDLVDYAAIENGKLRVNLGDLDLIEVVTEVGDRVKVAADKRKITMHLTLPKEPLPTMNGDPLRVSQVIQNLSTNAIQYTSEGGHVYIKVQRGPAVVTISVRDTGIGISKEDLPRIFQRFFQAKEAQKMRRAGFGLGLKIAQEIVKAHGGGMGVDSELGKGSVFYFTMPIPPGATPVPTPAAAPGYPSMSSATPLPTKVPPPGAGQPTPPGQPPPAPTPRPGKTQSLPPPPLKQ